MIPVFGEEIEVLPNWLMTVEKARTVYVTYLLRHSVAVMLDIHKVLSALLAWSFLVLYSF
jgi:hypothetical protein